jgi:transforming growth factor-beta-induced protein
MKKLLKIIPILLLTTLFLQSCDKDDDTIITPVTNNIVDIAQSSEDFTSLVAALQKADLVTTLQTEGPFTVLAPTNAAFSTFLLDNGFGSLDEVPTDILTNVLLNHVISGSVASTDLSTGYTNTLATSSASNSPMSLFVDTSNGVRFNGTSSVTTANISADNGIVHVVDAVIGLPTIATFATSNNALSNLVDALAYADSGSPTVPYISTVSDASAGPFTVFAPTNDAFANLLTEINATALTDLSTSTVNDVLLYHIVGANVQSGQLTTGTVETLGGNITADTSDFTLTDPNNRVSNIITSLVDIQAENGVVHVIGKVILPLQQPTTNNIVDVAVGSENLSTLVAALERADLVTTLANQGPFTVLAPSNEAFNTFLSDNGFNNIDDVPVDVLNNILRNHVVGGRLESTDLTTGYASTFATTPASDANMSIFIDISNGVKFNGISSVTDADISADNGIVHVVDAVIGLPSVVTFAVADPTFSTLVAALTRDDLTTDFVGVLSTATGTSPAPFTVFAPTNDAFGSLLSELGIAGLADIDEPTLDAVLKNHVVAGANVLDTDLTDDMTVTTLGGDITANVTGGATLTDSSGRVSDIIATNIQANNGVIHAINKVILP